MEGPRCPSPTDAYCPVVSLTLMRMLLGLTRINDVMKHCWRKFNTSPFWDTSLEVKCSYMQAIWNIRWIENILYAWNIVKILKYYSILEWKQFHNVFAKVNQQSYSSSALLFFFNCVICVRICVHVLVCVAAVCTCAHVSLEARYQHWVSSVTLPWSCSPFHLQNDGLNIQTCI